MDEFGYSQVLIVCGTNVGANRNVIDPITSALGDRFVSVFAQTTPEKDIRIVLDGVRRIANEEADCVIAVGSGSSINVARAMCLVDSLDREREEVIAEARNTGRLPVPNHNKGILPNMAVPTTMAGADLTYDGGVSLSESIPTASIDENEHHSASFSDPRLMPTAVFYDPDLFATTPVDILAPSAMNGFDKGIETIYSRESNPISRAHALQGLHYLRAGLPELRRDSPSDAALEKSALGTLLVQYERKTNIIHAFGNGVSDQGGVHQGVAHAVMAPHVLRYVFECTDGERRRIATALNQSNKSKTDDQIAADVVSTLIEIRDELHLPSRLRDIDGVERSDLWNIAESVAQNRKHSRNPPNVSPSTDDVYRILETAW